MVDILKKTITLCLAIILIISFAAIVTGCSKESQHENTGVSMMPTIKDGQVVTVIPLKGMPKTGDIVLINKTENYDAKMIKRVIAVAGQDLKIDFDNNKVYVDGELLEENYIQGTTTPGDIEPDEINGIIPDGKIFVMGDNRQVSLDSRYKQIGLIDIENINGVVKLN